MQIQNIAFQAADFNSSFEKGTEKPDKPEAKLENNLDKAAGGKDSEKLKELTSALEENNITLTFSQDKETKALVVKLVDKITGEAVRQIPNEVSLKLTAVNAKLQGNFLDKKS